MKKFLANLPKKLLWPIGLVLVLALGFGIYYFRSSSKTKVTYETSQVKKGSLVSSISGSGTITSGNYTNVTTKVSGTVKKVYVKNGDTVKKGQKIAEVRLDEYATERATSTWVDYLEATESVKKAEADKITAYTDMIKAHEKISTAQEDIDSNKADGKSEDQHILVNSGIDQANADYATASLKYQNANMVIADARSKAAAAYRVYQENAATIVAPAAGVITDLSLAEGMTVTANSSTSNTNGATIVSSQTVGKVNDKKGQLIATVNLTEVDIVHVKADQKVTLTLDAYSDKSFTGKVLAVNTSGTVSSGVTSYPVTILLDPVEVDVYPNMAVSVEVITSIKPDVLMVPVSAVETSGTGSTVQVMKDSKPQVTKVEVGDSNGTAIEVKSGITEGDTVVTATIDSSASSTTSTTSPFSGIGRTSGTSSSRSSGTSGRTQQIFMGGPGL